MSKADVTLLDSGTTDAARRRPRSDPHQARAEQLNRVGVENLLSPRHDTTRCWEVACVARQAEALSSRMQPHSLCRLSSHELEIAASGVEEQPYRGSSVKLTIEVAAG